jgi:CRISPR type III-B/RAMP module-associated protein Cmr5
MIATAGRQTLDQRRAAHAWGAAERAQRELGEKAKREFGTPAKKLGPRILTAGLGPAVQFVVAKKEAPQLVEALEAWLLESGPTKTARQSRPRHDAAAGAALIADIVSGDSDRLRWLTAETLAYLAWLTRFCEARGLTGDETR